MTRNAFTTFASRDVSATRSHSQPMWDAAIRLAGRNAGASGDQLASPGAMSHCETSETSSSASCAPRRTRSVPPRTWSMCRAAAGVVGSRRQMASFVRSCVGRPWKSASSRSCASALRRDASAMAATSFRVRRSLPMLAKLAPSTYNLSASSSIVLPTLFLPTIRFTRASRSIRRCSNVRN